MTLWSNIRLPLPDYIYRRLRREAARSGDKGVDETAATLIREALGARDVNRKKETANV